jgi:hypothetical protein
MCGAEQSKLPHAPRVGVLVTQAMYFPPLRPTLSTDTSAHAETAPERQDGQHTRNRSAARRGVCVDLAPPSPISPHPPPSLLYGGSCDSLSPSPCGTTVQRCGDAHLLMHSQSTGGVRCYSLPFLSDTRSGHFPYAFSKSGVYIAGSGLFFLYIK